MQCSTFNGTLPFVRIAKVAAFPLLLFIGAVSSFAAEPLHWTGPATNGFENLASFLAPLVEELQLPGLAAAVVHNDHIVAAGVAGERKVHSGVPVKLSDPFHIGSCTKSMTALLAVELARRGMVRLDLSVGEAFPDWQLEAEKSRITLELLLQNRSGIAGAPSPALWLRAFDQEGKSPSELRVQFLREVLKEPLESRPGTRYIYSNLGFALAGAMIEAKTKQSWEDLMVNDLFRPLRLQSAGFGAPSHGELIDAPWGHQRVNGELSPIPPRDNPVTIAPAGLVHLSILDLARYAAFHLDCSNRKVPLLQSFRDNVYTPPDGSDYAYGWIAQTRSWARGKVLTHAGSNTMFYSVIWIAPEKDYALVVSTNVGDKDGAGNSTAEKCDRVVAKLISRFIAP